MDIAYDVAHNIGKQETHKFKGNDMKLVVPQKRSYLHFNLV